MQEVHLLRRLHRDVLFLGFSDGVVPCDWLCGFLVLSSLFLVSVSCFFVCLGAGSCRVLFRVCVCCAAVCSGPAAARRPGMAPPAGAGSCRTGRRPRSGACSSTVGDAAPVPGAPRDAHGSAPCAFGETGPMAVGSRAMDRMNRVHPPTCPYGPWTVARWTGTPSSGPVHGPGVVRVAVPAWAFAWTTYLVGPPNGPWSVRVVRDAGPHMGFRVGHGVGLIVDRAVLDGPWPLVDAALRVRSARPADSKGGGAVIGLRPLYRVRLCQVLFYSSCRFLVDGVVVTNGNEVVQCDVSRHSPCSNRFKK